MNLTATPQFDFGENWKQFSQKALTITHVAQARADFRALIDPLELNSSSFLDIGFGQGLSLLTAASLGARCFGCDINSKCEEVLLNNIRYFPEVKSMPTTTVGSILDSKIVDRLRSIGPAGGYDVVHSWGVLHHTGNMRLALVNTASLVAPGGYLILAIYNRHWSSRVWVYVKWMYVAGPRWLRRIWISIFYPIIYFAKWMVTQNNPKKEERGMDFYFNLIDWVGGYPYEYASVQEFEKMVRPLGFTLSRAINAVVPTGCNQFIFQRQQPGK